MDWLPFSALGLGLLLGLKHAIETDHVVAVTTLVSTHGNSRQAWRLGMFWGVGHTLSLLLFGIIILLFHISVPERVFLGFELVVGFMLVLLGVRVLWKFRNFKLHHHTHEHDGEEHKHLHAHHKQQLNHDHGHKSLAVGFIHGLAGSGALVLLVLSTIRSPWVGLLYIVLFGLGSIAGMALVTKAMTLPLQYAPKRWNKLQDGFQIAAGALGVIVGLMVIVEIIGSGELFV